MKKYLSAITAMLVILLMFTSCSSSKFSEIADTDNMFTGEYAPEMNITEDVETEGVDAGELQKTNAQTTEQKLIKEQYIYFETKEFDTFIKNLTKEIEQYSGYIQQSNVGGNSYSYSSYRDAEIIARIPAKNYDSFSKSIEGLGNVTQKRENTVDATASYIDIESRLKALEAEKEALMKILENAQTTEDLINVQNRISNVMYEIEKYESTLRSLENKVNYCTVTINVEEVEKETLQLEDESMFVEIKNKFMDNLDNIIRDLRSLTVWFASNILYLIIWAVVFTIAVLIIKRKIKKSKEKRKKRAEAQVNK